AWRAVALVALTIVLAARGIDSDVYEGGEAREGLVAREMVETGDWILPLWNGSVVPSKPPLFHWLVATGTRLTGEQVTERTLRAPSVVLAAVVVLIVFLAGLAWGGPEVATLSALVLATTPQFLTEAGDGRVDMTLTAAITAAQVALVQALHGRRGARLALAVCLALAMLAKGPVGPGLVGLTALAFATCERRFRPVLGLVRPLPVLVFLALAGGWYGLAYAHRGMDFVAKQVLSENGEALLGATRFPYRSPLYYVGPLAVDGLPWTLLVPWAAVAAWRGTEPRRYALVWATTVWLFFSLAPLKRAAYVRVIAARQVEIVALALAATLAAVAAARALAGERWRRATFAVAGFVACAGLLALGIFAPARAAQKSIRPFARAVAARLTATDDLSLLTADEEIPFIFYVGRQVPLAEGRPQEQRAGYYVLDLQRWADWGRLADWEEVLRSPHVFSRHRRDLVLVRRR